MIFRSALLILLLARWWPLCAETIQLTVPFPAVCVMSAGAQFTVEDGALHPVRGEFSIAPPDVAPLQPRFLPAVQAQPGEVARLYLATAEPLDEVRAEITDSRAKVVAKAVSFSVARPGGEPLVVILAAIPLGTAPGTGRLEVRAVSGERTWEALSDFTLMPRIFSSERIGLNGSLTSLATTPDPAKTAESERLAAVLSRADPDAVYEPGPLVAPFAGARRTSGFGDRRTYDYSDGTRDTTVHLGVDIASPEGTPVSASGKGRVVLAEKRILTGNTVVIEHLPGVFSLYYHLSSIVVSVGHVVEKGAIVGAVGMTGLATGPHLHWQVEVGGTAVDPDALTRGPLLDKEPAFPDIGTDSKAEGR
jgi:murein DD-endopeptidase MepM/ murein hydrolase activator NlpD